MLGYRNESRSWLPLEPRAGTLPMAGWRAHKRGASCGYRMGLVVLKHSAHRAASGGINTLFFWKAERRTSWGGKRDVKTSK